jgi:hypothetical protein
MPLDGGINMRQDMKDLLVNTGRHAGYGKAAESRRARFNREDPDQMVSRISTARNRQFGYDGKSLGDRLKPLYRFLEHNCGRPWAEVYHEICEVADHRSIRGYHLRQHVEMYVQPTNYDVGLRRSYGPFFVDTDGTLQKERVLSDAERAANAAAYRRKHKFPEEKKKAPNPKIVRSADLWYEKIEGFWYEFVTTHYTYKRSVEDLIMLNGEVQIVTIPLKDGTHHDTKKRQVGSKEIKKLDAEWAAWVNQKAA